MINNFTLALLPPPSEIETREVLKQLLLSHRHLAELKGIVKTIPNEQILINTLSLQEAKSSSEIENIVTTHDWRLANAYIVLVKRSRSNGN